MTTSEYAITFIFVYAFQLEKYTIIVLQWGGEAVAQPTCLFSIELYFVFRPDHYLCSIGIPITYAHVVFKTKTTS